MRIYLVRHGETLLNQKHCYYGVMNAVLSEKGIEQAKEVGQILKGARFDYIFSSPLVRAYNTAQLILDARQESGFGKNAAGLPGPRILTEQRLCEQNFGIFEGMPYEEIQEKYPQELAAWNENFIDYRIPEGESFLDVRKRAESFVNDLPEGDGTALVVAHKGTLGHMMATWLHLPVEGYWNFVFEQGAVSVVDIEDGYAIIRKLNAREI